MGVKCIVQLSGSGQLTISFNSYGPSLGPEGLEGEPFPHKNYEQALRGTIVGRR